MVWLATSPCSEISDCYTVRWCGIGFGWWNFSAYFGDTKLADFTCEDYELGKIKSRARCANHADRSAA